MFCRLGLGPTWQASSGPAGGGPPDAYLIDYLALLTHQAADERLNGKLAEAEAEGEWRRTQTKEM